MATSFNTNPNFLSQKLFLPDRPRIGAQTYLNVNLLPDFIEYLKKNLTQQELISLSEYQLQTYIMQLSIKQKITESFDQFVERILSYIRKRKQFWINDKIVKTKQNQEKQKQDQRQQHEAIVQFSKDIQHIRQNAPNYEEKSFSNLKKRKIQQSLQLKQTNFIDKDKQVLKINLTNYSMMPAYVLREYRKTEKGLQNLPQYEQLTNDERVLLENLQNATGFFLMQQKPRMAKTSAVKKRQNVRQRRIPAYLAEDGQTQVVLNHQIDVEIQAQQIYSKESHQILHNYQGENSIPIIQIDAQNHHSMLQNIPVGLAIYHKQKNLEEQSQNSNDSSSEDSQNQFYTNFGQEISKKQFYDSKMFNKEASINQSHNIMEILRCLIYHKNEEDEKWFYKRWNQLEDQKTLREKKRIQQEKEDQEDQQEQKQLEQKKQSKENNQQQVQLIQNKEQDPEIQKQEDRIIQQQQQHNHRQKNAEIVNELKVVQPQENSSKQKDDQEEQKSQKQQEKSDSQIIEIGVRRQIFDDSWKNPTTFSFRKLSKHLSQKFLTLRQVFFVVKQFCSRKIDLEYKQRKQLSLSVQNNSKSIKEALVDPEINLDDIYAEFKQMIEHPQNIKLGAFKTQGISIPWQQTHYLLFLKGLLQYFFIPTNNRKIALYMMGKSPTQNIEANHVKYVKGNYLKNMQIRIDRGESGGGKKGRMLGKTEFIEKDIEFFSMKWFDKIKKSKKKLNRRKRFDNEDDAGEEVDSAY